MAKKSKRSNIPQETLERARAEMRGDIATTPTDTNVAVRPAGSTARAAAKQSGVLASASRRIPTQEELKRDYQYVIRDLRSLIVVAAFLMAIIIVAAVFLPTLAG